MWRSCADLHGVICLYRRTTGPIRRAKGGWTAEEVSIFFIFLLREKRIELGILFIRFNVFDNDHFPLLSYKLMLIFLMCFSMFL
jgi:hypothetical protein